MQDSAGGDFGMDDGYASSSGSSGAASSDRKPAAARPGGKPGFDKSLDDEIAF